MINKSRTRSYSQGEEAPSNCPEIFLCVKFRCQSSNSLKILLFFSTRNFPEDFQSIMNPTKSDLITMILCELLHTEQAYVTDLKQLEETLDKVKRVHANDKHVDALIADSKKLLSFQTRFLNKLEEKCRMQALSLFLNPDLDEEGLEHAEEESNAAELEFDGINKNLKKKRFSKKN